MSTQTITEFLLERIAEDERHARKLAETDRRPVLSLATTINHPQRLLAECAAKRAIIEQADEASSAYSQVVGAFSMSYEQQAEMERDPGEIILRALAAVYANHPDYNKDWAL